MSHVHYSSEATKNPFSPGDQVYLQHSSRCDVPWSGPHRVTEVKSAVVVELDNDGVLRHVSHLRRVPTRQLPASVSVDEETSDNESDTSEQFGNNHSSHSRPSDNDTVEEHKPPDALVHSD